MNVLLAHGSSYAAYAGQLERLAGQVSALLGELVGTAYLSDECLPEDAVVLPLLLGEGTHMRQDVPRLIERSNARLLPSLAGCADALAALVVEQMQQQSKRVQALFVVYRFTGFEKIVAALYAQAKSFSCHGMATLHGCPRVADVLPVLQGTGKTLRPVVIQPMLLFAGHSLDECLKDVDGSDLRIMPPLAELDGFAALLADQFIAGTTDAETC